MFCMYSHWAEAFPCRKSAVVYRDIQYITNALLEKIILNWKISLELHSGWGTHFIGQIMKTIIWPLLQYFHCVYHPNPQDSIIKMHLAKFMESFNLPWPKALLIVLLILWSIPFYKYKLSPFEIITGGPMKINSGTSDPCQIKRNMLNYFQELSKL